MSCGTSWRAPAPAAFDPPETSFAKFTVTHKPAPSSNVIASACPGFRAGGEAHEATEIHRASRRRGSRMAARSAGAAADEDIESGHGRWHPEIITALGGFRTAHG